MLTAWPLSRKKILAGSLKGKVFKEVMTSLAGSFPSTTSVENSEDFHSHLCKRDKMLRNLGSFCPSFLH